jgi:hypothetical protein
MAAQNLGHDLQNGSVFGVTLPPKSRTATENGTGVDMFEAVGPVTGILMTGVIAGEGPLVDIKFQESKNDNTADAWGAADAYADISGAAFAQLVAADDNVMRLLTFHNREERYVRGVYTHSGSATATLVAVGVIAKSKSY